MPVPTIDLESGALYYPQWLTWEHQFSATNTPYDWSINSGAFPTGMTFQPALSVTGASSGNLITATAHGLDNGTQLVFRSKTGGSSVATATIYFVISATTNTFQLSATPGGSAVALGSDITAAVMYRPGFLTGAATVPGVSTVRLIATNATGASAEQLFTVGIVAAAAVPDANVDLVWDFAANTIIAQTSSTLALTPAPRDTPIMSVKGEDDVIIRLRTTKSGSMIDLGAIADNACKLVLKEFETDGKIIISDASVKIGEGDANSIMIHAQITGSAIKAAFTNYEADAGTYFYALAEIELTYPNPGYFAGSPASLKRTSPTFRIQTERDLGDH